jgi:hypothetical protein
MEIYEGKNDLQDELGKTVRVSGYGTKESTLAGGNKQLPDLWLTKYERQEFIYTTTRKYI